jgi:hypothetical protein
MVAVVWGRGELRLGTRLVWCTMPQEKRYLSIAHWLIHCRVVEEQWLIFRGRHLAMTASSKLAASLMRAPNVP